GGEKLEQRILQLEAELQMKEASLQDLVRRTQVSSDLVAHMRAELRKQSTRLVVLCSQRSGRNDPDG
ncbi:hypothetical protein AAVH_30474, partial [Aphelenchoides avenae]